MRRKPCAWGFVARNPVPPFYDHSPGAIFQRWRKLPTIPTRRRNPSGGADKHQTQARARSGQAFEERSRAAHARQGLAARPAADRPGARRAAQSRHRPGHRGTGLADRAEAAGGQLVRPPRRFSAAHRARKSTGFGEAPQAGYGGKGPAPSDATPSGVDAELAQALGFEGDDAADGAAADKNAITTFAASPAPPPRCRRWRRCCARAARNSASGRGRRTARRGRKSPKAAGRW